jgi:hypothetical protein
MGSLNATENNSTTAYVSANANLTTSTSPVTSIELIPGTGSFVAGSTFYLYGTTRINAASAPSAPTIGTATDSGTGSTSSVTFTAPGSGSAVDIYKVTSSPDSITGYGHYSPITVSGLSAGTAYTFTVTGVNNQGTGTASSASNSLTLAMPLGGFIGGSNNNTGYATTDKLTFNSDTIATSSVALFQDMYNGVANSGVTGYVYGSSATISKTPFTTESTGYLYSGISHAYAAPFANSGTAGYAAGGNGESRISKMPFSTETAANISATLSTNNTLAAGFANSGTAGYVAGGNNGGSYLNTIAKVTFSNDTRSNIAATLSTSGNQSAGASNNGTAGYVGSRWNGTAQNLISKVTYSNDTQSTIGATMAVARYNYASFAKSGTAGYFCGGNNSGTGIDKLLFSNDSRSTLSATLSGSKVSMSSYANSGVL